MFSNIKAFIFDLDNTLVNADLAYKYSLQKVGIDPLSPLFSESRRIAKGKLAKNHTSARNRLAYIQELLRSEKKWSSLKTLEIMTSYEVALKDYFSKQNLSLGRQTLLNKLKQDYRLTLLSNENLRTQLIKLSAIDPDANFFEHMITSEEYGIEKPNLLLFQAMLDYLQLAPTQVAMVGDDYKSDIEPALQLGLTAILTTEFTDQAAIDSLKIDPKVHILNKLNDLPVLLSKISKEAK